MKERWGSLEELAKGLDNPPSYRCGGGGGGGGGGGSRSSSSRGWKRPAYSRREEEEGGGRQRQRRLEGEYVLACVGRIERERETWANGVD